jgi:hypothetical protein
MTRILAITPSFTAWRRAADRLLALETTLALHKRTPVAAAAGAVAPTVASEESEVEKTRALANALFEIAQEETKRARGQQDAGTASA